jgi:hypothetical protein
LHTDIFSRGIEGREDDGGGGSNIIFENGEEMGSASFLSYILYRQKEIRCDGNAHTYLARGD